MDEPKTLVSESEGEAQAIAAAEVEIDAGQGVPHETVRQWLLKLMKGDVTPPPCK